jgi:hypothetical protein
VLKGVWCLCAHFKSGASILYSTAPANFTKNPSHQGRKVEGVLYKIGAAVRCEMDAPDLKCAHEHRTPLSTIYVPLIVLLLPPLFVMFVRTPSPTAMFACVLLAAARAGKKARGSRAGSGSIRLGSAR